MCACVCGGGGDTVGSTGVTVLCGCGNSAVSDGHMCVIASTNYNEIQFTSKDCSRVKESFHRTLCSTVKN